MAMARQRLRKRGGHDIGINGHKKIKGDKVVAFCDRNCNVIAPFVAAPGNHSESPLLRAALPNVTRMARSIGLDVQGTIVSLDGVYDCRQNRKAIFNRGMVPNINANPRGKKSAKRGRKPSFNADIFKESFDTRFERLSQLHCVQNVGLYDDQLTPLPLASTAHPVSNCAGPDRAVVLGADRTINSGFRLKIIASTRQSLSLLPIGHARQPPATPETRNQ
jgi:hypothetical protein